MPAAFAVEEYRARIRRVERSMARRGLDALVVSDPANMNYLTGYDGYSFYVPQAVILVGGADAPWWIGRPMDRNGARLTTWLADEQLRTYPETYIQADDHHPMDAVADLLRELGAARGTVGVEMDAYYFTARSYAALQRGLPDAAWRDSTLLVNWLRLKKSQAELEAMRRAGALVDAAMRTAAGTIRSGVRECEAAADVFRAEIAGLPDVSGEYTAIAPLMPSNERTAAAHLSWADRRYRDGDAVNVELAGCFRRYHVCLARTVIVGSAPGRLVDLGKAVAEGVDAALDAVRPGARCEDVEAAWRAALARHGYSKSSRIGYPVGIGYPPDWGEHTASLRQGDQTVLEPGMTFHLMAGMWMDDHGLEISETFAVAETGCEVLTHFPRGLITPEA